MSADMFRALRLGAARLGIAALALGFGTVVQSAGRASAPEQGPLPEPAPASTIVWPTTTLADS